MNINFIQLIFKLQCLLLIFSCFSLHSFPVEHTQTAMQRNHSGKKYHQIIEKDALPKPKNPKVYKKATQDRVGIGVSLLAKLFGKKK